MCRSIYFLLPTFSSDTLGLFCTMTHLSHLKCVRMFVYCYFSIHTVVSLPALAVPTPCCTVYHGRYHAAFPSQILLSCSPVSRVGLLSPWLYGMLPVVCKIRYECRYPHKTHTHA